MAPPCPHRFRQRELTADPRAGSPRRDWDDVRFCGYDRTLTPSATGPLLAEPAYGATLRTAVVDQCCAAGGGGAPPVPPRRPRRRLRRFRGGVAAPGPSPAAGGGAAGP